MTRKEVHDKMTAALSVTKRNDYYLPEANEANVMLVALEAAGLIKFDEPKTIHEEAPVYDEAVEVMTYVPDFSGNSGIGRAAAIEIIERLGSRRLKIVRA